MLEASSLLQDGRIYTSNFAQLWDVPQLQNTHAQERTAVSGCVGRCRLAQGTEALT